MKKIVRVFSEDGQDISSVPYFSGEDLVRLRRTYDLTQQWMANHLGKSEKTIRRWEKLGPGAIPDTIASRYLAGFQFEPG